MTVRPDDVILAHSDRALSLFGDTPQGANWPNEVDRRTRFDVMLDVISAQPGEPVVLCDLGCGTGELLAYIRERGLTNITYIGVDRSAIALSHARIKFPGVRFIEIDVNDPDADLGQIACDYLVANGLFTVKWELSQQQMLSFLESTVLRVWPWVGRGIAFNVMSKVVDWERDDLFHAPMDDIARMLHALAGRRIRFRADYGLYEYTAYAYKPISASAENALGVEPPHLKSTKIPTKVPVLRPLLPRGELLLPYLRRIDDTRIYSNYGPLVLEFEGRLAKHFGQSAGTFVTAGSGTSGLVGAVLATAGRATPQRPLALLPAFTFVATAVAVEQCGYSASLADIEPESWMLNPEQLLAHPHLDRIGVVIPVAAFGRPVEQAPWLAFRQRTGIPVVIDGAASFEGVSGSPERYLGEIPVMMSFHATKSFAIGEGGCVGCSDAGLAARITQALNFGFLTARDSRSTSTNGKLSEFHAAVGLAELDNWEDKLACFHAVANSYRRQVSDSGMSPDRLLGSPWISSSYCLFRCQSLAESERIQASLREHDIEFRLWYGTGLQAQSYFSGSDQTALPVTKSIAPLLLGIPMAVDLSDAMISRVVQALQHGLARGS